MPGAGQLKETSGFLSTSLVMDARMLSGSAAQGSMCHVIWPIGDPIDLLGDSPGGEDRNGLLLAHTR